MPRTSICRATTSALLIASSLAPSLASTFVASPALALPLQTSVSLASQSASLHSTSLGSILTGPFVRFPPLITQEAPLGDGMTQLQRCELDSLDVTSAIGRVEWYQQWYTPEIVMKAGMVTGTTVTQAQAIAWYRKVMLEDPILGGPAARPSYPTFALPDLTNPLNYSAPTTQSASANKPANYRWAGICLSSCYKPGEQVLFALPDAAAEGGERFANVAIESAQQQSLGRIAVVSDDSTLETPGLQAADVAFYTESITATTHEILNFQTEDGGSLKVTPNHPLLDATGTLREARTFQVGDSLVHKDGTPDPITEIGTEDFFGKVYNVAPRSPSLLGNLVVAQDFLAGSAWYQNSGIRFLNRGLLRSSIPDDVLE